MRVYSALWTTIRRNGQTRGEPNCCPVRRAGDHRVWAITQHELHYCSKICQCFFRSSDLHSDTLLQVCGYWWRGYFHNFRVRHLFPCHSGQLIRDPRIIASDMFSLRVSAFLSSPRDVLRMPGSREALPRVFPMFLRVCACTYSYPHSILIDVMTQAGLGLGGPLGGLINDR